MIENYKRQHHDRIVQLCRESGFDEPDPVAEQLFLLMEGARVSVRYLDPLHNETRLLELAEALIAEAVK